MNSQERSDEGIAQKNPTVTISIIAISYLLLIVDGSVTTTALPDIRNQFNMSSSTLSWVQNSYSLAFGGLLLLGARIGDLLGRLRMFVSGLFGFVISSLMVAFAPSTEILLIGRICQGVAAAVLAPSTLVLLSISFPKNPLRARAFAIYSSITGIGTTFGLVLGGFVTDAFSWRWAFLINLPIGIILIFAAKKYLIESGKHSGRIDYWGSITSIFGMSLLVFGLVNSSDDGWSDSVTVLCLISSIFVLALFVFIETRTPRPLMPLHLLKSRHRSGSNFARFLLVGSMAGYWFFVSQFLQIAKGFSPLQTGVAFLPMTLASFGIAFLVPRLSRLLGDSSILVAGLFTVMLGTFWLSRLSINSSFFWHILLPLFFVGIGQGASTIRLSTASMHGVNSHDAGAASGIVSAAVQLGNAFGLSLLLSIASTLTDRGESAAISIEHTTRIALASGGSLIAIALITTLVFVVKD